MAIGSNEQPLLLAVAKEALPSLANIAAKLGWRFHEITYEYFLFFTSTSWNVWESDSSLKCSVGDALSIRRFVEQRGFSKREVCVPFQRLFVLM